MGSEQVTPKDRMTRLRQSLATAEWKALDFGFNLGRRTGAIDVKKDGQRFLFYPATPADSQSYRLLVDHKLPVFPTAASPVETPEGIVCIELPLAVRALDSMEFPDQEQKVSHLGSFEIMDAIAKLLARIYKRTGMTPDSLKLNSLGIVEGDKEPIRLIPPLNLVPQADWIKALRDLREDLKLDLDVQNPQYAHGDQIKYLEKRFEYFLENEDR